PTIEPYKTCAVAMGEVANPAPMARSSVRQSTEPDFWTVPPFMRFPSCGLHSEFESGSEYPHPPIRVKREIRSNSGCYQLHLLSYFVRWRRPSYAIRQPRPAAAEVRFRPFGCGG